ncbi:DUF551 domain-containing protein [Citrobacter sp. Marseille-Q3906]|uniref:DUF551 domain-containing protein n=1 Tax=Citrobacter sp. Marseille-Q3906 TaxID=2866574 RepID=UPI001CE4ADC1|nr:DUF551 domain-containing protein [Citrobacter sp. Marseille-Q3906]
MTTNHPAHGPVSLDRLHQIREILSKAAAQSDGGNLGYAMADAVKVIDVAIAAFDAEPMAVNDDMAYAFHHALSDSSLGADEVEDIKTGLRAAFASITAQPALRFIPAELTREEYRRRFMMEDNFDDTYRGGWNACRSAMLQAGNSPVTPDGWIPVSDRMPYVGKKLALYGRRAKEDCAHYVDEGYLGSNGFFYFFDWEGGPRIDDCHNDDKATVTHWMYWELPAAPHQEVNP